MGKGPASEPVFGSTRRTSGESGMIDSSRTGPFEVWRSGGSDEDEEEDDDDDDEEDASPAIVVENSVLCGMELERAKHGDIRRGEAAAVADDAGIKDLPAVKLRAAALSAAAGGCVGLILMIRCERR